MIVSEQERNDLLELINQYGNARSDEIHLRCVVVAMESTSDVAVAAARQDIAKAIERIRAMLAPDDAVVIPRELAKRVSKDFSAYCKYLGHPTADADALRAVLRREATRDE